MAERAFFDHPQEIGQTVDIGWSATEFQFSSLLVVPHVQRVLLLDRRTLSHVLACATEYRGHQAN